MKIKVLLSSIAAGLVGAYFIFGEIIPKTPQYTPREEVNNDAKRLMGGDKIFSELRANVNTGEFEPKDVFEAREKVARQTANKTSQLGLNWKSMGPDNQGGRTRAILVDNQDSQHLIAGSVSGGLFQSFNGGSTWEPINDLMPSLIISTIDQGPDGTIYVGTGSEFEGSAPMPGGGIFKSTDGGETFEQLQSTIPATYNTNEDWSYVNRLKVHPDDDNKVFAGTSNGLFVSTDGGETWTKPLKTVTVNCTQDNAFVQDIEITPEGRVLVGLGIGVWYSDEPTVDCSYQPAPGQIPASIERIDLDYCDSDPNYVYAITTNSGDLGGVFRSTDGGLNWSVNTPLPPTTTLDSTFNLFGTGQGFYDLALEVFPNDCEKLMIGGVQIYKIDGSWIRVAETFASPFSGIYVHADQHYFTFDPNDPNTMYIGNDGGVGVSYNATSGSMSFSTLNRNYTTTQFYDIAVGPRGEVLGGTQDNGTFLLQTSDTDVGGTTDGIEAAGGDGFDTEISKLGEIGFVSLYYNRIIKFEPPSTSTPFFEFQGSFNSTSPYAGLGKAPFRTKFEIWESADDSTSIDSITFRADTVEQFLGKLTGSQVAFSGTVVPNQPAAEIAPGSISFFNPTPGNPQRVNDYDGDGTLENTDGDSVGTFDYNTYEYSFSFDAAPADQSDFFGYYAATFNNGDVLKINSATLDYSFDYTLTTALNVGDSVRIQDPVQAYMASVTNDGIIFSREVLDNTIPEWHNLADIWGIGGIRSLKFSQDGNHLFIGTVNGNVHRISGFRNLYMEDDPVNVLTYNGNLFSASGNITGFAIHPNDPEKILVTVGNYGNQNHVYELDNAVSSPGAAVARNAQGNLEDFPVFDAEYHVLDPNIVLLGTDFGIWSTSDFSTSGTNVTWSNENANLANVPVFEVRQQKLGWTEATNNEVIYAGTHGRGIWRTSDLVNSTPEYPEFADRDGDIEMKVYPNPMSNTGTFEYTSSANEVVDVQIYDLSGKLVRSFTDKANQSGKKRLRLNVSDFKGGTYIATITNGSVKKTARFIVVK